MAVLVSVDNPMVIACRVEKDIGVINAIHRAVNVKVIVFSLMVRAQDAHMDFLVGVILNVVGRVSVSVERSVGTAHLATSDIGETPVD